MRTRRQVLVAVVLLAMLLAAPIRALPAGQPRLAEAHPSLYSPVAPMASSIVFVPFFTLGAVYDVGISRVELIQGVTMSSPYRVYVAGRPAVLRVFVTLSGGSSLAGVSARVTRFVGGVQQNSLTVGPQVTYASINEGNTSHTFNFSLPGSWLTSNSSYVVDLDPDNAVKETNEANNRYPAAGDQPFNAVSVPALDVVIVPVQYKYTLPPTSDLGYLTWLPAKVLPVPQINYSLHAPIPFNGNLSDPSADGWSQLLSALHSLHMSEDPSGSKVYYGLVDSVQADGCASGCIAGIGYISQPGTVRKTAVGFAGFPGTISGRNEASGTFTHEMGHTFGRRHTPCGNPSSVDTAYPYPSAVIGQWGYDTATGALYNPGTTRDYMSYCGPEWTSDYTYYHIAQSWSWLNATTTTGLAQSAAGGGALLVNGYFSADGAHLDPLFAVGLPASAEGHSANRLELVDAAGQVLATVPLELSETIIEAPEHELTAMTFQALVPQVRGVVGLRLYRDNRLLLERLAPGSEPVLTAAPLVRAQAADSPILVAWQAEAAGLRYRVRFSPDGWQTWTVLALETAAQFIAVPAGWLAGASQPLVEVQASDGVRTAVEVFTLESGAQP